VSKETLVKGLVTIGHKMSFVTFLFERLSQLNSDASWPVKVLAGAAFGQDLLSRILNRGSIKRLLQDDYDTRTFQVEFFSCLQEILISANVPGTIRHQPGVVNLYQPSLSWIPPGVLLLESANPWDSCLLVKKGVDLGKIISDLFWSKRQNVVVQLGSSGELTRGIQFVEEHEHEDDYCGEPTKAQILRRLEANRGNRSMLFIGPSGTGKSTLARQVAKAAGMNRILRVHFEDFWTRSLLLEMVSVIKPNVVIIDDIPLDKKAGESLAILEAMREMVPLTIMTLMNDAAGDLEPGSLYYPGMRPGRIDDVIQIPMPDDAKRHLILTNFMQKYGVSPDSVVLADLVKATDQLSPAYLKELIKRISAGFDWKEEVKALHWQRPVLRVKANEEVPSNPPSPNKSYPKSR